MKQVSIVIPAYNEEHRLLATLASVYDFFSVQNIDIEIIVVSDGSTDQTTNLVKDYSTSHPCVKLIDYANNKGKGYAVRTGVLAADGNLILINDADGSSPIQEFERLNSAIKGGADIAIGSRAKRNTHTKVRALAYRTYIGNTFNNIVQSILLPGIEDTQCGFKLLKRDVARNIFSCSLVDGYAFDVEILYLARSKGYRIEEVSINWTNAAGSKVNIWTDSIKMLIEVLKISWRARQGKYTNSLTKADG